MTLTETANAALERISLSVAANEGLPEMGFDYEQAAAEHYAKETGYPVNMILAEIDRLYNEAVEEEAAEYRRQRGITA